MHKESFITNRNTLLHVSTLLGHLQGELFVTLTLGLHFTAEWECAVDCVLRCFWRRELSAVPACSVQLCKRGPHTLHASSTQSTAHSHSAVKGILSVTITNKVLPEDDSAGSKHVGVLRLTMKLSLCICWWFVFLYDIVHGHGTH
jgi:hypothetical protein